MRTCARFDAARRYRYRLTRVWDASRPVVLFIMLNPSTADERADDPTIRRCIGFARRWDMGGLEVVNLFAWRSPSPATLRRVADPVGPNNDAAIRRAASRAARIFAAWGNHGARNQRAADVMRILGPIPVFCLGVTRSGQPRHPLYCRADAPPVRFSPRPA